MNYEGPKPLTTAVPPTDLPVFDPTKIPSQMMQANQLAMAQQLPDITAEDARPNAAERASIAAQVGNLSIEDKIEDKIQRDIQNTQDKFKSVKSDPKSILKELIVRGEYRETINFMGVDWTIRALDQGDVMLAFDEVKDDLATAVGRLTALEFIKLVYSIEAINGIPIYDIFDEIQMEKFGTNKMAYVLAVKKALQRYLEGFAYPLIDGLYTHYTNIESKRNEALAALKNS